ncbi:uncharacterized protein LOC119077694 [Bradysia coprophila]|uniref:uncharacterized protein LOC119077694 n=1 Tax=Bradysia coprophila TaxID=38358 RepID=UPI00187D8E62|nr:uncharacterized protein LOC119077694 [Bradysia coprophila]
MKILELLLGFGILCKTIDALSINSRNVSFSVESVLLSYHSSTCSTEDDPWKNGVQKLYDGCRTASKSFRGKAYELAEASVNSLEQFITKLIDFTSFNSTIISTSSKNILQSMSKCDRVKGDNMNMIIEIDKIFPIVAEEYKSVAVNLSEFIGDELICSFTNAYSDFATELTKFMKGFLHSCRLFNCQRRVDYKRVLQKYHSLTNTMALIDQTLLDECENEVTQDVYESVLVLHLVYFCMGLSVTGVNSCALDVQYDHNCFVSKSVKNGSLSIATALEEILEAISAVLLASITGIKDLLNSFVNVATVLNTIVEDVLGLTNDVLVTVGKLGLNLLKAKSDF